MQKAWLKPYIVMKTKLRKEAKSEFEKDFFKLMNNSVFGKTMVSEPNYHATKQFSEYLLAIEMNKPVFIGMSILDINKILMYEFWYDYLRPKYKDKAKLCYMDTDSFVINIFTEDFFEDIINDGLIHLTMIKMIKDRFK